jgi:hypothetical protein
MNIRPDPDDTGSDAQADLDRDAESIIYTEERGLPPEKTEHKSS